MKFVEYVKDSINELKLVAWPSKKEAIRLTKIVVIASVVVAIFISVIDHILNLGLSYII